MDTPFRQRLKKYLKIMSVMSALSESCSYESLMCHLKGEYFLEKHSFISNPISLTAHFSVFQLTLLVFSQ